MTKCVYYVYIHRRADNNEVFYVGSAGEQRSANPSRAYKRARDGRGKRRTNDWRYAVDEAGGFVWGIISEHDADDACRAAEIEAISRYDSKWLVNQRKQAIVWGENKRRCHGRRGSHHPNFGKKLSVDTCRKKSESLGAERHHLKGKKLPDSWRRNIAKGKIGKKNPMYGKNGAEHPMSKSVQNTETGAVYGSIAEAARAEGLNAKTLYQYLDGTRRNLTPLRRAG